MKYYNMKVIVTLKENINYINTYEIISNFIARAMLKNEELKKLHEVNCYKLYTFCSFYPFEKDLIYKKGNMYAFDIRYMDISFGLKLKQLLKVINYEYLSVISLNIECNEYKIIQKLISLTPAILTINNQYNTNNDLELVKQRIIDGSEKKYKTIYNEDLKFDFIKSIKQTNIKPIKIPYKNIHILGYKYEIEIKEDEISQKLAHVILSTGILEKNSQGFGFCKAR